MSDSWRKSIALIRSSNSAHKTFGTGFSVCCEGQATYIVTCAHVVDDILVEIRDGEGESGMITAADAKATLVVSGFQDGRGIDLAVLRVETLLDRLLLRRASDEEDKSFRTAGFQRSDKDFIKRDLSGRFGGQIETGRGAQANFTKAWDLKIESNYHLQDGYSGSPVVDENDYVVAVVNTREGEGIIGTAISIEALEKVWPERAPRLFERSTVRPIENKTALQLLGQASPQTYSPRRAGVLKYSSGKTLPQPLRPQLGGPGPASIQANPSRPEGVVGKTEETIPPQPVHPQTVGSESASIQSRPTGMKENPPIEAQPQSMQNQPIGPRSADIQTLQKRVVLPFQIIAGLGFIAFIIDIVLAVRGYSPTWWIWTSSLTVIIGGSIVAVSIEEMSLERFSKTIFGILNAIIGIFVGGFFIGLIIDIVLAVRGHSPTWWIWTITIGALPVGGIFAGLLNDFEKKVKQAP